MIIIMLITILKAAICSRIYNNNKNKNICIVLDPQYVQSAQSSYGESISNNNSK